MVLKGAVERPNETRRGMARENGPLFAFPLASLLSTQVSIGAYSSSFALSRPAIGRKSGAAVGPRCRFCMSSSHLIGLIYVVGW
jgi:hypothetical protein